MIVSWVSIEDGMPIPFQNVLIQGGIGYWDGNDWYTCMERDHPKIQWEVKYWATLPRPPSNCSGCVALEKELTTLRNQMTELIGL